MKIWKDDDKALKNKMETEEKELEKMVEDLKKEYYKQCHFFQVSFCILVDETHTENLSVKMFSAWTESYAILKRRPIAWKIKPKKN